MTDQRLDLAACRALETLGYEPQWPGLVWCMYTGPDRWELEWWESDTEAWRDGPRGACPPVEIPYYACPDSIVALDWLGVTMGYRWGQTGTIHQPQYWVFYPWMSKPTGPYDTPSALILGSAAG